MKIAKLLIPMALAALIVSPIKAQDKLYINTFALSDVELLDGPFKHAQDLNVEVLLQYDVDRLLAPFFIQAGLEPKGELFPNWAGLDGHMGGHYLSAMAIHYASTGNQECLKRMEYMLSELKRCQDASGDGYIGGVPDSKKIWSEVKNGNIDIIGRYWVPWYNVHKIFAGLRDAWLYTGNKMARQMFLDLCDWGISVTSGLSDEKMEQMLNTEYGGMNEVYADAYQMTGDKKYLETAKRFTHHQLFDSMLAGVDNMDNKHANTQVPKVVGFSRVAEVADDSDYLLASDYFWDRVANHRSIAFGGNSRREHFPSVSDNKSYVEEREGPESCNTHNMLKLTENLFRMNPKVEYADFYENALYNHILSTQHPEHGGYVYFTPARPAHYRVYSQPNEGMWCCVGTGMENHGKYGEFIYSHEVDDLYVNLFIASKLQWKYKKVVLTQNTSFPDSENSKITVNVKRKTAFRMMVRCPGWVTPGDMKVMCGGIDYAENAKASEYIVIDRTWKDGDVVEISMKMKMHVEKIENVNDYIAIKKGPILLGVKTGTEDMAGIVADDSRWGHIASGRLISAFDAPFIVGSESQITQAIENARPVEGASMTYTVPNLFQGKWADAKLEPFFRIHDSRYSIYYLTMTPSDYVGYQENLRAEEAARLALDERTIDAVQPGEQQPEVDHQMKNENSSKGNFEGEPWRNAVNGGFFEYTMNTEGRTDLSLMIHYWGNESERNNSFDILVDGEKIVSEKLFRKWNKQEFVDVVYALPETLLNGKKTVTVRFQSAASTSAGRIFHVRLVRPE
jgi:uncharacterized protein